MGSKHNVPVIHYVIQIGIRLIPRHHSLSNDHCRSTPCHTRHQNRLQRPKSVDPMDKRTQMNVTLNCTLVGYRSLSFPFLPVPVEVCSRTFTTLSPSVFLPLSLTLGSIDVLDQTNFTLSFSSFSLFIAPINFPFFFFFSSLSLYLYFFLVTLSHSILFCLTQSFLFDLPTIFVIHFFHSLDSRRFFVT